MARVRTLAGKPIEQHNSPNRGSSMSDHRGIVLHIAQGSYNGTINWQNNPDQRYQDDTSVTTCSTWIVGREPGEWAQMVDTAEIAWCQQEGSRTWLSIELAGFAPAAPSAWQVEACAQLLAWAHRQHGVALAVAEHPGERGLGHHAMDREWLGESWGHDECPGVGVIGAKAAIVRRAKEIIEGDDMPTSDEVANHLLDKEKIERSWDGKTQTLRDFLKWRGTDTYRTRLAVAENTALLKQLVAGKAGLTVEQVTAATAKGVRQALDPDELAATLAASLADQLPDITADQLTGPIADGLRQVLREGVGEPASDES